MPVVNQYELLFLRESRQKVNIEIVTILNLLESVGWVESLVEARGASNLHYCLVAKIQIQF